ncbi:MAG TPA: bifunctional diaminohydroxyphosphoribosylaminopyrimidine deaminase/5-amino-6-(5-phosphoribosylamino)uracil reductase RibD, partial [Planctomycetaceae bacterium]|nr:bifunctional diaminohydroxyphosphoribosylaminopyrimidine deaminase/5-amino-6-(5-phosphoribosylamino)uracil reductase RibD [Planctomycetaceae bacterium]
MPTTFATPQDVMQHALTLAARGVGAVEPNPPVGAVIVDDQRRLLGEGWHQRYGGPHAEVFALEQAGAAAHGATLFVTLEPCCHFGKTPPCSRAIIAAGIRRVVVAMTDPNPQVAGQGIAELHAAGLEVEVGLMEAEARWLTAPFVRLVTRGLPWVHAKWAMTLDGKIASREGHSQWISSEGSRAVVHQLRGRMDAIVVGIGTAVADDPLLTPRPPGVRTATRVVIDPQGRLPLSSKLVQTAGEIPVLCVAATSAEPERIAALQSAGVEVWTTRFDANGRIPPTAWLTELGRRRMTHVLVEGGGQLLGSLFDADLIDEWHVFIAPKFVGGVAALSPLSGQGLDRIPDISQLVGTTIDMMGDDLLIRGRTRRDTGPHTPPSSGP